MCAPVGSENELFHRQTNKILTFGILAMECVFGMALVALECVGVGWVPTLISLAGSKFTTRAAMRECFIPIGADSSGGLAACTFPREQPAQTYRRLDRYFLPDAFIIETKFIFNIKRRGALLSLKKSHTTSETFRVYTESPLFEINKLISQVFQTDRFCFPISLHVFIKKRACFRLCGSTFNYKLL